jgi:hypothetical protein
MKKISQCAILLVALCCFSCRDMVNMDRPEDYGLFDSWVATFESYWTGMNNNYLFWDIDPTDWDAVYREYQPKFAVLGYSDEDFKKAYRYFQEITKDLVDGHYGLTISDGKGNEKYLDPTSARRYREHGLDMYEYLDSGGDRTILDKSPTFTKSDGWTESFNNPLLRQAVQSCFAQEAGSEYVRVDISNYEGISFSNFRMATGRLPVADGFILYFQFSAFSYRDINTRYGQLEAVYAEIDAANTAKKAMKN